MSRAIQPSYGQDIVSQDGEVIESVAPMSSIEAITRAEIDVQIATAKRYPRSLTKALHQAKSMVSLDPDLAAACTYWLPKRKGSDEQITGPSIRLAEIMAGCWGNLRVVGRITDDDGKFLTAQGVALDLETNVGFSVETKRGVTYRNGGRFGDDMIKTTGNAAISIATRNAIFRVIPRAFVNLVENAALEVARGDVKTLPDRVEAAIGWFRAKGVDESRVFAAIEVGGREDMTLDTLGRLNGMRTAIKEGFATVAELFPVEVALPDPKGSKTESVASKLASTFGKPEPAKAPVVEEREPGADG